ncbi:MAG: glycine radical domain-containing protein, partial [Mobilitalea sp.]
TDTPTSRVIHNHSARLINIKISPQVLVGEKGIQDLMAFIRTFVDLKLWHVQFSIINKATLEKAQKNPEKYRNLIVRVAGYSAYFTDLSPGLQNEIINRTEHQLV